MFKSTEMREAAVATAPMAMYLLALVESDRNSMALCKELLSVAALGLC